MNTKMCIFVWFLLYSLPNRDEYKRIRLFGFAWFCVFLSDFNVCFGVFLLVDCYMSMTLNLILNSPYDAYKMRGSTYELNVFFCMTLGQF